MESKQENRASNFLSFLSIACLRVSFTWMLKLGGCSCLLFSSNMEPPVTVGIAVHLNHRELVFMPEPKPIPYTTYRGTFLTHFLLLVKPHG